MLLVVLAVVLLLATRVWDRVMPQVSSISGSDGLVVEPADHGQPEAVNALGQLPNLEQMRQATDAHTAQVDEAMASTE